MWPDCVFWAGLLSSEALRSFRVPLAVAAPQDELTGKSSMVESQLGWRSEREVLQQNPTHLPKVKGSQPAGMKISWRPLAGLEDTLSGPVLKKLQIQERSGGARQGG